ncbi:hypothetical protein [Streptomyces sp. WM6378]|uniref:hypothetical protein n=1 Tax=Streptomyces sp. WM6378 TaxID=1415557 RepID=UPI00131C12F1|nr:hypothetical protein [Streptomyces sp. WM6378]
MEPYKKAVDAWLRADLEVPRKQRHTVVRIAARIEEESGETIPYPTVRDFVAAAARRSRPRRGCPWRRSSSGTPRWERMPRSTSVTSMSI